MNNIRNWAIVFFLVCWPFIVFALAYLDTVRTKEPREYYSKCLGCGTEWVSDKPSVNTTTCPNCPLSEEEFEALQKQLREVQK